MSATHNVFLALMDILASKQPISARDLIKAMNNAGHDPIESRKAIQLAFERGTIRLDDKMRAVIVERHLAAA